MSLIKFDQVSKYYQMGEQQIKALDNISFEIFDDSTTIVLGPSGSGKSTTLNLLGGMDKATKGKIIVDGQDISKASSKELERYRREKIGFVFQFYNLFPSLTVKENVAIAAQLSSNPLDVQSLIAAVGLSKRINLFPSNLSGGELQRLSIARALVKHPKILLCDEPTGALDSKTGEYVLKLLQDTAKENKIALVIVTHNASFAKIADQVIYLSDGKIDKIVKNKHPQFIEGATK